MMISILSSDEYLLPNDKFYQNNSMLCMISILSSDEYLLPNNFI